MTLNPLVSLQKRALNPPATQPTKATNVENSCNKIGHIARACYIKQKSQIRLYKTVPQLKVSKAELEIYTCEILNIIIGSNNYHNDHNAAVDQNLLVVAGHVLWVAIYVTG